MLKIISLFLALFYTISSELKWSDTCQSNSCFILMSFCNLCYGQRQCIGCIASLNPDCRQCAENIYDNANTINIDEIEYSLCNKYDDFNQKLCHFYCRGRFNPTGQCNLIQNQLVCQCLSNINATTLSTTTTSTSTSPVLVMASKQNFSFPATISSPKMKGLLDGNLAVGFSKISIIDSNTGIEKVELIGHNQPINALGLLSNGNLVSASFIDGTIKVWDLNKYEPIKIFSYSTKYFSILKNDDLVIVQNKELLIIDYLSTRIKEFLIGHQDVINCVTVLSGNLIASGSNDKVVKIWEPNAGILIRDLTSHTDSVYTLAQLQNGNLATGSADKTIKIWKKNSWELLKTFIGHTLGVIGLSPMKDGLLASISDDKTVKLWNVNSLNYTISKRMKTIFGIETLITGELAVAGYNEIYIWSTYY